MISLMKSKEKEAYTRSDKVCKQRFNPFARRSLFFQPLEHFPPSVFFFILFIACSSLNFLGHQTSEQVFSLLILQQSLFIHTQDL